MEHVKNWIWVPVTKISNNAQITKYWQSIHNSSQDTVTVLQTERTLCL